MLCGIKGTIQLLHGDIAELSGAWLYVCYGWCHDVRY
jgi:hypothetical protein